MKPQHKIRFLGLNVTGVCNLACTYCYAHEHSPMKMSEEIAIKAVELGALSKEPFVIQFTGGEPLLAVDIMETVAKYVEKHQIPALMQVQSNGTLITKEIAQFLKSYHIAVGISLDGRPDVNDRTRVFKDGSGTSPKILEGIRILGECGIEIGITCTVTHENSQYLSGIVEMAYYLGSVRRLGFDLLRGQGRGASLAELDPSSITAGVKGAFETARKLEMLTGKPLILSQLENVEKQVSNPLGGFSHCHAMRGEAAYVDPHGRIYGCASLVGHEEYLLGHVRTGIESNLQVKMISKIEQRMSRCKTCSDFNLCGGGCYARLIGLGQNDHKHLGECALKRESIKWYMTRN